MITQTEFVAGSNTEIGERIAHYEADGWRVRSVCPSATDFQAVHGGHEQYVTQYLVVFEKDNDEAMVMIATPPPSREVILGRVSRLIGREVTKFGDLHPGEIEALALEVFS